jgi:hypothetical protein
MVKIRYSELPVGLHVTAESEGRSTVVYLLPGLTAEQRRAALCRVRSSGRMGQGPRLPAFAMGRALAADQIRMTARNGAAAVRRHPMLLLPPLILVSGAIVFVLMSFVTLTAPPLGRTSSLVPSSASTGMPGTQPGQRGGPGGPAGGAPGPSLLPGDSPTASLFPSGQPSEDPSPASGSPVPSAHASPSPTPTPTPTPTSSGTCLKLGPLGLCVNI